MGEEKVNELREGEEEGRRRGEEQPHFLVQEKKKSFDAENWRQELDLPRNCRAITSWRQDFPLFPSFRSVLLPSDASSLSAAFIPAKK